MLLLSEMSKIKLSALRTPIRTRQGITITNMDVTCVCVCVCKSHSVLLRVSMQICSACY